MADNTVSDKSSVDEVERQRTESPLPLLSTTMPEQQSTTAMAIVEVDVTVNPIDPSGDMDSLAEEQENASHSPNTRTMTSTSAKKSKVKGNTSSKKRRRATAPSGTALRKVKPEPAEESTVVVATTTTTDSEEHDATGTNSSNQDQHDELNERRDETRRGGERPERNLPTMAGMLTRRAKAEKAEDAAAMQQEKLDHDNATGTAAIKLEVSEELLHDLRLQEIRGSQSRSHSTAPHTPTVSIPTSASPISALRAKQEEEEVWEAAVQAAIDAQERQLRHTLLSVFPLELLQGTEAEHYLARERDLRSGTEAGGAGNGKDVLFPPGNATPASLPSSFPSHSLSPEPLLPLLKALCEDKAYVHGAWCRYEDDLAVRRTQNSIQRKRQRYSFSRGGRKASSSGATTAARCRDADGDGEDDDDDNSVDEDKAADEDELQPPESYWVETPPTFTGASWPFRASATHLAPNNAISGGFQWTPWRFYREKRRRSSRRPPVSGTSLAAVRSAITSSTGQPGLLSAASSNASVSSGGVPSLACSEVPSLPVLQVDAHVPESAVAVVSPMTPEERKGYARYVMSSGKLRHDCRDPYTFLVSRAKEMRIQWKRQHPMD
ncbi:hypothetical protein, conserved [Leishmania tarentolae]|uniref:Uncharacterized protein n=1 Tax=Leishmania tarentolae TaxID=5689 RepID=A0A640KP15_LEITA|nr:hypothetical protein, conserved [Leishmania tarentolae]